MVTKLHGQLVFANNVEETQFLGFYSVTGFFNFLLKDMNSLHSCLHFQTVRENQAGQISERYGVLFQHANVFFFVYYTEDDKQV